MTNTLEKPWAVEFLKLQRSWQTRWQRQNQLRNETWNQCLLSGVFLPSGCCRRRVSNPKQGPGWCRQPSFLCDRSFPTLYWVPEPAYLIPDVIPYSISTLPRVWTRTWTSQPATSLSKAPSPPPAGSSGCFSPSSSSSASASWSALSRGTEAASTPSR